MIEPTTVQVLANAAEKLTPMADERVREPGMQDAEAAEARVREYRLAEFFSSLATVVDLLRETVEEMEREDGLTDAGEHSYGAAKSAIAALAHAEMSFYEDDGVEAEDFADFYSAVGESPPPGARHFAQFPSS